MGHSKKYNDIIDASQHLFYKYGIRKVTIEKICAEAKVSKMTFYKYFPNKTELARAVLDKIFSNTFKRFSEIMESNLSFPEKMHGVLQMKIESAKGANWAFVMDLYKNSDAELSEHVMKWIQKGFKMTVDYFMDAKQKGFIRKDITPTFLLVILDKLREMALDERMIAAYDNAQEMGVEITKFFLYGIFDEQNN